MIVIDTLKVLEELESLVEDSKGILGFRHIDMDEFSMLVSKVRASLPEDVRRAGRITQNTDRILEAAQSEADLAIVAGRDEATQIVSEARVRAQAMVDQSEIIRIATAQAKDIVTNAETEAQTIRRGADEYARDVLVTLEDQVENIRAKVEERVGGMLSTIQRGRQKLESRGVGATSSPAPDRGAATYEQPVRESVTIISGGRGVSNGGAPASGPNGRG